MNQTALIGEYGRTMNAAGFPTDAPVYVACGLLFGGTTKGALLRVLWLRRCVWLVETGSCMQSGQHQLCALPLPQFSEHEQVGSMPSGPHRQHFRAVIA